MVGADLNNVKMSMNPFCEIAVEQVIEGEGGGQALQIRQNILTRFLMTCSTGYSTEGSKDCTGSNRSIYRT